MDRIAAAGSAVLDVYAWRAECMAHDGISTGKDFEQGCRILAVREMTQSPWDG
ncbi:hypothetical protein ACFWNR_16255 [Streptomyces virginiae]|uniref:hypothetical protein n=1 Tax=Streptomyces virginiae TaxID=1961 RepID=UPI0036607BD9